MKHSKVAIVNKIEELSKVVEKLELLGNEWGLPQTTIFNLNLIIEELVSNTIFYGYEDEEEHLIEIELSHIDESINLYIIDDGREFNPLKTEDPDVEQSLEDREIGGLGIYFVKELAKSITYERMHNKNILKIALSFA